MSTPSLLLVPARLKAGTLFSQIPTNGSGDFTVVQAVGNATRYNSSGFVESAKTNLALQSENFGTTWTRSSGGTGLLPVITANDAVSPDGNQTADKIDLSLSSGNTVSDISWIYQNNILSSGQIYAGSVWLKAATQADVGKVIQVGYFTYQSYTLTADWVRITLTQTPSSTANQSFGFRLRGAQGTANSASFHAWGAQLEVGSSASDYIPTTTVARTKFSGVTVDGTVAANIPRLDYYTSNGTPGCPGLLVEPSGTNLAFNSQTWTSANNWRADVSGNITTVTGAITAPDGTMTANAISPTAVSGVHGFASLGVTYASGTNYTMSAFFKQGAGVGRFVQLTYTTAMNSGAGFANFDLQLGTVAASGGTGNVAARIENYGNGWYRCIYTATCNANAASALGVLGSLISASGSTRSQGFAGVTGDVLYGWGAQLETGSFATSYIPTTTAQRTRNADVISASGGVSGSIGQTEGSIYVEVDIQKLLGTTQRAFIDIGQTNNRLFLGYGNGITNQIRFLLQTSSGGLVDFQSAATTTGIIRIAVGYKNNDSAMYVNGVSVSPLSNGSFTATLTTLSNIYLGSSLSAADFLNDKINAVALYGTRLSNDALMLLSMQGNDAYLPQAIWNFYEDSRAGNTEVPTCLYTRHADLLDV